MFDAKKENTNRQVLLSSELKKKPVFFLKIALLTQMWRKKRSYFKLICKC